MTMKAEVKLQKAKPYLLAAVVRSYFKIINVVGEKAQSKLLAKVFGRCHIRTVLFRFYIANQFTVIQFF